MMSVYGMIEPLAVDGSTFLGCVQYMVGTDCGQS